MWKEEFLEIGTVDRKPSININRKHSTSAFARRPKKSVCKVSHELALTKSITYIMLQKCHKLYSHNLQFLHGMKPKGRI